MSEERLHVAITADASGFDRGMGRARETLGRFVRDVDGTAGPLSGLSGMANATGSRFAGLASRIGAISGIITGAAAGFGVLAASVGAIASPAIKAASEMEQASVTFRVLTKDAALAAKTLDNLKTFAANTPFEFKNVREGAAGLLAYGFTAQQLIPLLTNAGDAASAFGVDITEVTRALGRVKAGDFGEAFERLRDFGISRKELEGQGLVFDKGGEYKGSVDAALTAVQNVIKNKYGGMMAEQSKTLAGQFANLKDQAYMALADIGQVLIDTLDLKGVLSNLGGFIGKARETFMKLLPYIKEATTSVANLWRSFSDLLIAVWDKVSKFIIPATQFLFTSVSAIFSTASGVLEGVFKTLTGILTLDWIKFSEGLQNITVSIWNGIVSVVAGGIKYVGSLFAGFLETMGAGDMAKAITAKLDGITAGADKLKLKLQETSKAGGTLPEVTVKPAGAAGGTGGKVEGGGSAAGEAEKIKTKFGEVKTLAEVYKKQLEEVDEKISNIIAVNGKVPQRLLDLKSGYQSVLSDIERRAEALDNKLNQKGPGYDILKGVNKKSTYELLIDIVQNVRTPSTALPGVGQFAKQPIPGMDIYNTDGQGNRKVNKGSETYMGLEQRVKTAYAPAAVEGAMSRLRQILEDKKLSPAEALQKAEQDVVSAGEQLTGSLSSALGGAAAAALSGMGELIGGLISGTAKMSDIPKSIGLIFADLAKNMGKALISFGTAGLAAKAFMSNPAGAIAAGIGLIALGSALQGVMQKQASNSFNKFADGGAISGPTFGLMGEYPGASTNKEYVGRFDQFSGAIAPIVTSAVADAMPVAASYRALGMQSRTPSMLPSRNSLTPAQTMTHKVTGSLRFAHGDFVAGLQYVNREYKDSTGGGILD